MTHGEKEKQYLGGKGLSTWITQKEKSNDALVPLERLKATEGYCLLARLYQMPDGVKPCLPRPPPLLKSDKVKWKSANLSGIAVGDILVIGQL